ncbi:MAG: glycosyltransferase [Bacteroidetes bacterium]|nr:glycosyltransferase [Bacteroidota bacterium]
MQPVEVLYMSYDGMTDPLGQSQVIPYLQGLSKKGYRFTLISFEKKERFEKFREQISSLLKQSNIEWIPLSYTKRPSVLSTVYDVLRLRNKAFALHKQKNFQIVHCRSYISSLVGLEMKKKTRVKFIFDMRGFYADERVDGGLWDLSNPVYKRVYDFFKRKEKQFLAEADYTISLTDAGKKEIHSWKEIKNQPIPIQVIPCCADLEKFSQQNVNQKLLNELRQQFSIEKDDFILSYLGSIGTWYMPDEMLDFFKYLLEQKPKARFLFITNEPKELILSIAKIKAIDPDRFIFVSAPHPLVPTYLALATAAIFFIKPVFSKKASSPTKQGEIMGMGIPYICNGNVGDVEEIVKDTKSGFTVNEFSSVSYCGVIDNLLNEKRSEGDIRNGASKYYSLEEGVKRYASVYQKLLV